MATTNRDEIAAVLASLIDVWGRHDAEAYGRLFTHDASYITFVGTIYCGRHDIVESHRVLFNKFLKGTQLADEITDIRFFGADTAIVVSRGDTFKGKRPQKLSKVQTYTLVREGDGQWRIAAFHNTKHKRLLEAITFKFAPGTMPTGGAV